MLAELLFTVGMTVGGAKLGELMFRGELQEWRPYHVFKNHLNRLQKNKYSFTKRNGIWEAEYVFTTKNNIKTYFLKQSDKYVFKFRCGYSSGFTFYYDPEKNQISGYKDDLKNMIPKDKETEFTEFLRTYVALIMEKIEKKHYDQHKKIEELFDQKNVSVSVVKDDQKLNRVNDTIIQDKIDDLLYLLHSLELHIDILEVEEQHQFEIYRKKRLPLLVDQYNQLTEQQQLEEKEELIKHLTLIYHQVEEWKVKVEEKNKQNFKKSLLLIQEDRQR